MTEGRESKRKPAWKTVPNDVTHAQMDAGIKALRELREQHGGLDDGVVVSLIYLTMLEAFPEPSNSRGNETE